MTRTTTTAFDNAIAATVTAVGYLVRIVLVPGSPDVTLRMCDLGDQTYDGYPFYQSDLRVEGFALASDKATPGDVVLTIQNLDDAATGLVLNYPIYDAEVTIWQVARDIGSPGDAVMLAQMVIDGADLGLDAIRLRLVPTAMRYTHAPRKKVDAANGLANATPEGTKIPWGNEVYIVEAFRG